MTKASVRITHTHAEAVESIVNYLARYGIKRTAPVVHTVEDQLPDNPELASMADVHTFTVVTPNRETLVNLLCESSNHAEVAWLR